MGVGGRDTGCKSAFADSALRTTLGDKRPPPALLARLRHASYYERCPRGCNRPGEGLRVPFVPESDSVVPLPCSAVLTHHWLVRRRGGERVLEALAELLPDSPIYTFVYDPAGLADSALSRRVVRTSLLQYVPGARRHYPKLLPLLPLAAWALRLPPVDLVVCSDAALAKAMRAHPRSKVVCYCHSPMRYAYEEQTAADYRRSVPSPLRPLWGVVRTLVRRVDRRAARRVNLFIANSRHVAERIRRYYGADAVVVYPPVDIPPQPWTGPREDFYLCVGYHAPYKRLDLAIEACRRIGRRLVVIGEGPQLRQIDPRKNTHVACLGWQPDEVVRDHYRRAAGLLFPGIEDFGIVPVEAMAHGCPVIAFGQGGAAETVVHGVTGVIFRLPTADTLAEAIQYRERLTFDPQAMHRQAQRFARPRFLREMRAVLAALLDAPAAST
jgi:glycosyltransferase involved in cell wall biosynthesis